MAAEEAANEASEKGELEAALDGVARLYGRSLSDHGLTSKGVGWKDEGGQLLRFEKLCAVLDRGGDAGEISVNDLGCGYGAMFRYLDRLPGARLSAYHGYDISDEMLAAAASAVADPRAEFVRAARATREADYSFVSGTFNVKQEASDEVWAAHVREMILNLAEHSRKGFAFNVLSTYVDWKQENLFYADPLAFFDFCKRHVSPYVALLHDYPLYEWTICVRQRGPGR